MHIVRSDGKTLDLGDGTEWVLRMNDMNDWLGLDYSVETSANVLTDGSTIVAKRVEEKDRTVSATYWGRDRSVVRNEVIPFFNPKHSYEVHLTYMGRTRWCAGEQIGFDLPMVDWRTPPTLTWTVLSTDPYLRSEDGNENSLTDAAAMFGFPYVSHVKQKLPNGEKYPVGFLASKMLYDGMNTVYNSGDVPAMYRVHVDFDGYVLSPTITKDGKHVQVIYDFYDGDTLDIDFTATPPTVEINGKNAIGQCSRDSNFTGMAMTVGPNIFNYDCKNTANRPYMRVQVLFHKNYLGI